jgi:hypothetical protein
MHADADRIERGVGRRGIEQQEWSSRKQEIEDLADDIRNNVSTGPNAIDHQVSDRLRRYIRGGDRNCSPRMRSRLLSELKHRASEKADEMMALEARNEWVQHESRSGRPRHFAFGDGEVHVRIGGRRNPAPSSEMPSWLHGILSHYVRNF